MKQLNFKEHCEKGSQHVFDFVVNHLLIQNEMSTYSPNGDVVICQYRGSNNLSCAVGCLISDEEYDPDLEERTIDEIIETNPNFQFLNVTEFNSTRQLISDLQDVHDDALVFNWSKDLEELAAYYKLTFNPPIFEMNTYGIYFLPVTPTITAVADGCSNYRNIKFVTGFKTGNCTKHQTLDTGAKHQIMGYSYQFLKKTDNISGLEEFTLDNLTHLYQQ